MRSRGHVSVSTSRPSKAAAATTPIANSAVVIAEPAVIPLAGSLIPHCLEVRNTTTLRRTRRRLERGFGRRGGRDAQPGRQASPETVPSPEAAVRGLHQGRRLPWLVISSAG